VKNAINEVIEGVEGITGIHCCDNFDWSSLMKTNLDVINFDAYRYGNTMSLYTDELKRFLERGGMISWGIVPTTGATTGVADVENENPGSLVERLEQVMQLVVDGGIDKEMLLESSWITPSCGCATLSIELNERVYDFTREVSQRMREKYFG
ncbi:methionine synthase, partial [Chloroflexota bacterium]